MKTKGLKCSLQDVDETNGLIEYERNDSKMKDSQKEAKQERRKAGRARSSARLRMTLPRKRAGSLIPPRYTEAAVTSEK
ncbi:MAG: hypothetical protein WAO35_05390 [Terriglobia bacterium]